MHTDKEYEKAINALIPAAVSEAKSETKFMPSPTVNVRGYNHCYFTEFFHKAMTRLAIEAGLRRF